MKKLSNENGATLVLALVVFLIAVILSEVIINAALTNAANMKKQQEWEQAYLTTQSAEEMIKDMLLAQPTDDGETADYVRLEYTQTTKVKGAETSTKTDFKDCDVNGDYVGFLGNAIKNIIRYRQFGGTEQQDEVFTIRATPSATEVDGETVSAPDVEFADVKATVVAKAVEGDSRPYDLRIGLECKVGNETYSTALVVRSDYVDQEIDEPEVTITTEGEEETTQTVSTIIRRIYYTSAENKRM